MSEFNANTEKARFVWDRYDEGVARGHEQYCREAARLEDFYLGGGRQWSADTRDAMESQGRPAREVNQCLIAVNTAAGYQIANRVDIGFQPRGGGADEKTARCMSKVMKQQLDNCGFRFCETEQFLDGLIQRRGYLDLRISYDDSERGELSLDTLDPLDVIPDPDARHYDPDRWADVIVTRWLTLMEIEQQYGKDAADETKARASYLTAQDNYGAERGVIRRGFGDRPAGYGLMSSWYGDGNWRRYRILDRQSNNYEMTLVGRWPGGDFRSVEGLPREHIAWLIDHGVIITKRRMRKVHWEVVAPDFTIFDGDSPYKHFTPIPYFPYFRRGQTIGMLDNAIDPQEVINKFVSQFEHIINSTANSGWEGEANSLSNMDDDEFIRRANETGLVLLSKRGKKPPQKIKPNEIPTGVLELINLAHNNFRGTTGVDENLSGVAKDDLSGIAIQSRQFAAQQQLSLANDNLKRSRFILARNGLDLIQYFMVDERIFHITEMDDYGVERRRELAVNVPDGEGGYLNDLTIGEYDITVHEQPTAVTFDNSYFEQVKSMKAELGVAIPDSVILRYSTLPDKEEIAKAIAESQGKADPRAEADAVLIRAKARLAEQQAVSEAIKAQYSAIQTAQAIVLTPQAAQLADALLRSGGYQDQDAAPIVPEAPAGAVKALPPPSNTHPLSPANADVGLTRGLSDGPHQPPE